MDNLFWATVVHRFCNCVILIICLRAILSWFLGSYNKVVITIYNITVQLTEPLIGPIRKLLSRFNFSGIDFSPLFAIIAVQVLDGVIRTILVNL